MWIGGGGFGSSGSRPEWKRRLGLQVRERIAQGLEPPRDRSSHPQTPSAERRGLAASRLHYPIYPPAGGHPASPFRAALRSPNLRAEGLRRFRRISQTPPPPPRQPRRAEGTGRASRRLGKGASRPAFLDPLPGAARRRG